jgi:hypothetical protein
MYFFNSAESAYLEESEPILTMKKLLREVSLCKIYSTLTGKQCARCACLYHSWLSVQRYMWFLKLAQ